MRESRLRVSEEGVKREGWERGGREWCRGREEGKEGG
jgi:hypothetical protein